jgi:hypothetical protein
VGSTGRKGGGGWLAGGFSGRVGGLGEEVTVWEGGELGVRVGLSDVEQRNEEKRREEKKREEKDEDMSRPREDLHDAGWTSVTYQEGS